MVKTQEGDSEQHDEGKRKDCAKDYHVTSCRRVGALG
jgi:hypothetical protein